MRVSTALLAVILLQAAAFAGADLAGDHSQLNTRITAPADVTSPRILPEAPAAQRGTAILTRTYLLPTIGASELRRTKQEASKGSAVAQFQLADSFDKCNPKQFPNAAKWYAKAAQQGYAPAQNALALMYWAGRGVHRDDAAAFALFQQAADAGLPSAQHNLGLMYLEGDAVAKNEVLGIAWLRVAADQGNHVSASVLEQTEPTLDRDTVARAHELAARMQVRFGEQIAMAQ